MPDNVVDIIQTQNELRDHGHWFTLWPERWSTYSDVHEWNLSRLADSELHNIPADPGIYTLLALPRHSRSSRMFISHVCRSNRVLEKAIRRIPKQGTPRVRASKDVSIP